MRPGHCYQVKRISPDREGGIVTGIWNSKIPSVHIWP